MRRLAAILGVVVALVLSACGSGSESGADAPPATAQAAPTVAGTGTDITMPESAIQADVVIVGVSRDERVQIRALPGENQPVAAEIGPGERIESLEQMFTTENGTQWIQVQAASVQGWVPPILAFRGASEDITAQVLASLTATSFASADEASEAIGAAVTATEAGPTRVVQVALETVAGTDSTTITTDLLGGPEDSVVGTRLTIAVDSGNGWAPVSVFRSPLCWRGVSAEGLCL